MQIIDNPIREKFAEIRISMAVRREIRKLTPYDKVVALRNTRDLIIKDLQRAKGEVEEIEEEMY